MFNDFHGALFVTDHRRSFCTTFLFLPRSQVITNPGVSVHTIDAHVTDNDIVKAGKVGHLF